MKIIRKVFVIALCFVFICSGTVFAAETEETSFAEQTEAALMTETAEETALPDEAEDFSDSNELPEEAVSETEILPADDIEEPAEEDTEIPEESEEITLTDEEESFGEEDAVMDETAETAEDSTAEGDESLPEDETVPAEAEEAEPVEETESIKPADAISASINILSSNANIGTFKFSVRGLESVQNISKVNLVIWHASDKSDQKTYLANKQSDGSYHATMYKCNHKDHTGTYTVKARVTYTDGSSEYVANTSVTVNNPDPKLSIEFLGKEYKFTAKYIRNCSQISYIGYAIWSDANGQDDIQWYQSSVDKKKTTSVLTSALSAHSDAGKFHVHVYAYYSSGADPELLVAKTFNRIIPGQASCSSFEISRNRLAGTFKMTTKGVYSPSEVTGVTIAVWCRSDKSDKVWYTAKATSSGNYTVTGNIKKHRYHRGTYTAKAFVIDKKGKKTLIAEKTIKMTTSNSGFSITSSDEIKYKAILKKVTVPGGIQKMQFAVWSDTGGQDDLVWYTASGENGGNYKATINVKNHKHQGVYHIHAYATNAAGTQICLCKDTFKIMPKVEYTITRSGLSDGNGKFALAVNVSSTSSPIKAMKFEVWHKDNKSDLYWYKVTGNSTGKYKVEINTANHYGSRGNYNININVVFENGLDVPLTSTNQYFRPTAYLKVPVSDGTGVRRIKYVNPSVSAVKIKVWTVRGGSGDSKTYKAKKDSNGTFYADVKMSDFTYDGKYNIQVLSGDKVLDSGSFIMLDYLEEAYKFAYDDSIGYSQIHRCLNPDLDCSSLVHYALKNTGYNVGNGWPLTTYNEESVLRSVGFSMVRYTNVSDLQAGDILLRDGHTEIYAGHGTTVGAHGDENDDIYGRLTGDQTKHEVSVERLVENWLYSFRLITYKT